MNYRIRFRELTAADLTPDGPALPAPEDFQAHLQAIADEIRNLQGIAQVSAETDTSLVFSTTDGLGVEQLKAGLRPILRNHANGLRFAGLGMLQGAVAVSPANPPQGENVVQQPIEFNQPKFFSFNGRIGRMRYLAYSMALTLVFGLPAAIVVGIIAVIAAHYAGSVNEIGGGSIALMILGGLLFFIPLTIFAWGFHIRRLNDMNQSGWLSLLFLVPYIGPLFMLLFLSFGSGTRGPNKYGAPPPPNTTGINVLAGIFIGINVLAVIGMIVMFITMIAAFAVIGAKLH
jgi:uncharacterized membrane protein YhaH (DUF805 family)